MNEKSSFLNILIIGFVTFSANDGSSEINITSSTNLPVWNITSENESVPAIANFTITANLSNALPSLSSQKIIPDSCSGVENNVFDCKSPGGYVVSDSNQKGTTTYNFKLEDKEQGILHFSMEDLPYLGEDCSILIGKKNYNNLDLPQKDIIYLFNVSSSISVENENSNCSPKFFYRISDPYIASSQMTNLNGRIESTIDPNGLQQYRPLTTFVWYIQPSIEKCFIELEISTFDLGSTSEDEISPQTDSITAQYDFLSITLDVNETNMYEDDYTFFGQLNTPVTHILPSCAARITFSSKMHFQDAKGFKIDYKAIDEILPEEDIEFPNNLSAWISLNGATITEEETVADLFPKVKKVIAEMAKTYLQLKSIDTEVRNDNVTIHEVGTCSILYCRIDCMAFFFSINATNDKNETIFTTDVLIDMMDNTEAIFIMASFQICPEMAYINWSFPIFFLMLVILFSFAIIALAICERDDAHIQKRKNNLRYLMSEWDTPWKRQSFSDISTSSASSQAPFVKKRFFFPGFGSRNKSKETNSPTYEVTEFKEFKSKPVDSNALGLNEVIPTSPSGKSVVFSNDAFNDDDEIFNKSSNPATLTPTTPNIPAEQSFQEANPFRHSMIRNANLSYGSNF